MQTFNFSIKKACKPLLDCIQTTTYKIEELPNYLLRLFVGFLVFEAVV